MAGSPHRPKVLLFDIGGVCVVSPFQAILDYEQAHNIPVGWVNFAISRSAPNGAWQRLERGEIKMDNSFFDGFNRDLRNPVHWREYTTRPVNKGGRSEAKAREAAEATSGAAHTVPPLPEIDAEWLFWEMMRISRTPDPWIYPALKQLRASGEFIIGALSNTVIFPPDHPYSQISADDVRSMFDVFVSSAHVGLRKPDPQIYRLAVAELDKYARSLAAKRGDSEVSEHGITAGDILFLDDIGENLKAARKTGMMTMKVHLGKGDDAVKELAKAIDMELSESPHGNKSRL